MLKKTNNKENSFIPTSSKQRVAQLFVKNIPALSVFWLILLCSFFSQAQQNTSPQVFKSAFIFKLIESIEWRNSNEFTEYQVALVGEDPALFEQLQKNASLKRINQKYVKINRESNLANLRQYQLVYITATNEIPLEQITQKTLRSNTLIVTENTSDKRNTMINLLPNKDGAYSFEVNKANITFEYLKLNPDILLLGGTEMDVAELLKESTALLSNLKEESKRQQDALAKSTQQLRMSQNQYQKALKESEEIRVQMNRQAKLLEDKTRLIESKNVSIREREGELLAIQNELKSASDLLRSNEEILGKKLNAIADKEKQVTSLSERINTNLQILEQQRSAIEQQKVKLETQTLDLVEKGTKLERQKWWLIAGAAVLIIMTMLIMIIVYYNKERKIAGQLLLEKNNALSKVQEKLLEARDEAQAANEAKSFFLANMSHEIRTPMNVIIGMLHLTRQTKLSKKQDNYLNKVDIAANTLLKIINDILDFSKVEAGELNMENIEFSLSRVLEDLANIVGIKIQQKGIEFVYEISPEIPQKLIGDPLRLGQILVNLTNNAMKFTGKGEVKVIVNIENKDENRIKLNFRVTDTGIGMEQEVSSRLFKPFSQADSSTTRRFGGTGLGLAICKRLIEQMDGSIEVSSLPGEGSSFSFSASFGYKQQLTLLDRLQETLQFSNKHMLIVVSNLSCQRAIRKILESFKCQTSVANSFDSCIGIIAAAKKLDRQFDNVLIDLDIAMQHIEDLKNLRTGENSKLTLLLSGIVKNEDKIISKIAPDMTIDKPVTPSSMFDTLMELFGEKNGSRLSKRFSLFDERINLRKLDSALKNKSILVVEDNDINQEVAREILLQANVNIQVASNGKIAVDKVNSHEFDCVLMDIQMPVMDGYQATRIIREKFTSQQLPIIAMTANAMGGDKEKCLKSGMNDYISKPIRIQELLDTLEKWIMLNTPIKSAAKEISYDFEKLKLLRIDGVNLESGAELMGDLQVFIELLQKFAVQQAQFMERAKALLDLKKFEELARTAHDLKGVSANLFIYGVSELANKLDIACRMENRELADKHLGVLGNALDKLFTQINRINLETITDKCN